jgi:hypothetical protein
MCQALFPRLCSCNLGILYYNSSSTCSNQESFLLFVPFLQVFIAVYQLSLRPAAPWLESMRSCLALQQQQGYSGAALKPASTWLEALQRLT